MNETIHERIKYLVDELSGSKNTVFAAKMGISEANIRGYIKNVMPKADVLEKIVISYDVNPDWLLTGNGPMLKNHSGGIQTQLESSATECVETAVHVPSGSHDGIHLVPLSAMAGAFTHEISVMEYECERYVIPAFKGADFLIQIKGGSMQPTYYSGDLVACQRVPLDDLFFQWNKTYVLDTTQGPLIKRIMPGSDANHVLIVSDNTDYPPFELHKEQFNGVALVRGLVRLE